MKKVAVFGNAGAGKSTLAKRLGEISAIPVYPLDLIQFQERGIAISPDDFETRHDALLGRDRWIIDGYGSYATIWKRLEAADTLVYIDLPLMLHYAWVTKRFLKGPFKSPEGWPAGSPLWSSTLSGYKVVGRCHRTLTPKYRQLVQQSASSKRVHHLRSPSDIKTFLRAVEREYRSS